LNFPQNFKIAASYRNLFCLSNNVCLIGYSGLSNSLYHVSCLLSCLIVKRILSIKNSFLLYCGNDWKTRKRNLLLIFFFFLLYFILASMSMTVEKSHKTRSLVFSIHFCFYHFFISFFSRLNTKFFFLLHLIHSGFRFVRSLWKNKVNLYAFSNFKYHPIWYRKKLQQKRKKFLWKWFK
jgi:hypothetical protein